MDSRPQNKCTYPGHPPLAQKSTQLSLTVRTASPQQDRGDALMLWAAGSSRVSAANISLCTCASPTQIWFLHLYKWEALSNLPTSTAVQCVNLYRVIPAASQESLCSLTEGLPSPSRQTQDYSPASKSVGIHPNHQQRLEKARGAAALQQAKSALGLAC